MSNVLDVISPGLETSVQELPGRIGYWEQGFPPSGPLDFWSFRLANLLAGNDRDAAALECQLLGPTLRFTDDRAIAITGADMGARLDGEPVPMWQTVHVRKNQVLALASAQKGMRSYVAISGAIATSPVLGSRATFHMAGVGGMEGYALKAGQSVPLGPVGRVSPSFVPEEERPPFSANRTWTKVVTLERRYSCQALNRPAAARKGKETHTTCGRWMRGSAPFTVRNPISPPRISAAGASNSEKASRLLRTSHNFEAGLKDGFPPSTFGR